MTASGCSVQLELEHCLELKFEQQHFHFIGGILVGLFLGAQVTVPEKGALHAIDMKATGTHVRRLYTEFWCAAEASAGSQRQSLWCSGATAALEVARDGAGVQTWALTMEQWTFEELMRVGEMVWKKRKTQAASVSRLTLGCDLWSQMKLLEGSKMWNWFWKIQRAVSLRSDIMNMASFLEQNFIEYHPSAYKRAQKFGFNEFDESLCNWGCYYVFQLGTEHEDFLDQCFADEDAGTRCSESLLNLGNMFLSEGLNPTIPVYFITSLSDEDLQKWKDHPSSGILFQIYTIITLPDALRVHQKSPRRMAAVNFLLAQEAEMLITTSSCSLGAFSAEVRQAHSKPSLYFDRQPSTSQQFQWQSPPGLVFPIRERIKWVFVLVSKSRDTFFDLTVAAVQSALEQTHLVPVCISTSGPAAEVNRHLVSLGVRVLYHRPSWIRDIEKILSKYEEVGYLPFTTNVDHLSSRLLRMDLPLVGFLDHFVLYTDVDILFTGDVNWQGLLGPNFLRLERLLRKKLLLKASFNAYYAPVNTEGLPKFFGVARGFVEDQEPDASVMLMNLKTLGESYFDFRRHVFDRQDVMWEILVSFDPCGYFSFYHDPEGKVWKSRISERYNKVVTTVPVENQSNITHFAGTNCEKGILPYLGSKAAAKDIPFESKAIMKLCGQACSELCSLYSKYLTRGLSR